MGRPYLTTPPTASMRSPNEPASLVSRRDRIPTSRKKKSEKHSNQRQKRATSSRARQPQPGKRSSRWITRTAQDLPLPRSAEGKARANNEQSTEEAGGGARESERALADARNRKPLPLLPSGRSQLPPFYSK